MQMLWPKSACVDMNGLGFELQHVSLGAQQDQAAEGNSEHYRNALLGIGLFHGLQRCNEENRGRRGERLLLLVSYS